MGEENCCLNKWTHLELHTVRGIDNSSLHKVKGPVYILKIFWYYHFDVLPWQTKEVGDSPGWIRLRTTTTCGFLFPGFILLGLVIVRRSRRLCCWNKLLCSDLVVLNGYRDPALHKIIRVQEFTPGCVFRKEYLVSGSKSLSVVAQRLKMTVPFSST